MSCRLHATGAALFAIVVGCGNVDGNSETESVQSALNEENNGTALTATASADEPICIDEQHALVGVSGTLRTTGSVDSALISVSIDGANATQVGTIEPQDFLHDGRVKTASYSFDVELSNGAHTLLVCFTQSGAKGRESKQTC